jgi:TAT (twin-arginine translocation) pathway signal sequence
VSVAPLGVASRRQFLKFGGATAAAVALVDVASTRPSGAATNGCSGTCTTTTVWMLAADWGYPRGPGGKTHLVSRASRNAAANRLARTQQDALDMNLHKCSYAPAIGVEVCQARADAAFATSAADWTSPWNGTTVSVLDLRRLPADQDPFACPASQPVAGPGSASAQARGSVSPSVNPSTANSVSFAFTGGPDRRWLLLGAGAVTVGTLLRGLSGTPRTARELDTARDP